MIEPRKGFVFSEQTSEGQECVDMIVYRDKAYLATTTRLFVECNGKMRAVEFEIPEGSERKKQDSRD